mgnify:CR=1 FL=1
MSVNVVLAVPDGIDEMDYDVGVAGGGADSLATRTPQEFLASAYSWMVHIVWSSLGSTLV